LFHTFEIEEACCQVCIPNIATSLASWVIQKVSGYQFYQGTCEQNGYEQHVLDKTLSYWSYQLDVELFYEL